MCGTYIYMNVHLYLVLLYKKINLCIINLYGTTVSSGGTGVQMYVQYVPSVHMNVLYSSVVYII